MQFDPDAYLQKKSQSTGFDPDAYLAQKAAPVSVADQPLNDNGEPLQKLDNKDVTHVSPKTYQQKYVDPARNVFSRLMPVEPTNPRDTRGDLLKVLDAPLNYAVDQGAALARNIQNIGAPIINEIRGTSNPEDLTRLLAGVSGVGVQSAMLPFAPAMVGFTATSDIAKPVGDVMRAFSTPTMSITQPQTEKGKYTAETIDNIIQGAILKRAPTAAEDIGEIRDNIGDRIMARHNSPAGIERADNLTGEISSGKNQRYS